MQARYSWQIKAARAALGLTLDDVAEATGLHRNSVHSLEKKKHWIGGEVRDRVSAVLESQGIRFVEFDGEAAVAMSLSRGRVTSIGS